MEETVQDIQQPVLYQKPQKTANLTQGQNIPTTTQPPQPTIPDIKEKTSQEKKDKIFKRNAKYRLDLFDGKYFYDYGNSGNEYNKFFPPTMIDGFEVIHADEALGYWTRAGRYPSHSKLQNLQSAYYWAWESLYPYMYSERVPKRLWYSDTNLEAPTNPDMDIFLEFRREFIHRYPKTQEDLIRAETEVQQEQQQQQIKELVKEAIEDPNNKWLNSLALDLTLKDSEFKPKTQLKFKHISYEDIKSQGVQSALEGDLDDINKLYEAFKPFMDQNSEAARQLYEEIWKQNLDTYSTFKVYANSVSEYGGELVPLFIPMFIEVIQKYGLSALPHDFQNRIVAGLNVNVVRPVIEAVYRDPQHPLFGDVDLMAALDDINRILRSDQAQANIMAQQANDALQHVADLMGRVENIVVDDGGMDDIMNFNQPLPQLRNRLYKALVKIVPQFGLLINPGNFLIAMTALGTGIAAYDVFQNIKQRNEQSWETYVNLKMLKSIIQPETTEEHEFRKYLEIYTQANAEIDQIYSVKGTFLQQDTRTLAILAKQQVLQELKDRIKHTYMAQTGNNAISRVYSQGISYNQIASLALAKTDKSISKGFLSSLQQKPIKYKNQRIPIEQKTLDLIQVEQGTPSINNTIEPIQIQLADQNQEVQKQIQNTQTDINQFRYKRFKGPRQLKTAQSKAKKEDIDRILNMIKPQRKRTLKIQTKRRRRKEEEDI